MPSLEILRQAVALARDGRKVEARDKLLILVDEDPQNEMAWIWLTGLVDRLDDKIIACENVLTINPANDKVRAYLQQLLIQQDELAPRQAAPVLAQKETPPLNLPAQNPGFYPNFAVADLLELAKQYEQDGKFSEALNTYRDLASRAKDAREFDRIYKEITRLESLQKEKIQYVAPSASIVRMAFGWPLLYLSLVFVQAGGKFFAYPAWYLWLGVPFVAFGSFLIALSEVKSRHPIWKSLFNEENSAGSAFARFAAGAMGWLLVIFPHLLLIADSVIRMQHFQIPESPF